MRDIMEDLELAWGTGIAPVPSLEAYDVVVSGSTRALRRNYNLDIGPQYIDISNFHYEASHISGDDFEPGGVIPAHITCRVLSGCPALASITPTPYPNGPASYSVAYQLKVRYYDSLTSTNYRYFTLGGTFIVTGLSTADNGASRDLTLDDELINLDYIDYKLSDRHGYRMSDTVKAIFTSNNLPYPDTANVADFYLHYTGDVVTARQALSLILEVNGCLIYQRAGDFYIRKLVRGTTYDGELPRDYVLDWRSDNFKGKWAGVYLELSGDVITWSGIDWPLYHVKDHPLVDSDNRDALQTLMDNRVKGRFRRGIELEYLFCPAVELGDFLCVNVNLSPNVISSFEMTASRFEWDGGAYCRISEARFDPSWRRK